MKQKEKHMSEQTKVTAYFNGVPTAPAVRRIMESCEGMQPGDVMNHEALEAIIGFDRTTNRYKTCVSAWIKAMEAERQLIVTCVRGEGYQVCTPGENIGVASRKHKSGVRRIFRAGEIVAITPRAELTATEQAQADRLVFAVGAIRVAEATKPKKLAADKALAGTDKLTASN